MSAALSIVPVIPGKTWSPQQADISAGSRTPSASGRW